MIAYIALSFSKRKLLENVISTLKDSLEQYGIQALVFVDQYTFDPADEKNMMQQAMREISNCDILLAETSEKAIGIGIEAGYAKAKGKKVIYLRHKDAEHSTTVSGISDYQVIYQDTADLQEQLSSILPEITKQ